MHGRDSLERRKEGEPGKQREVAVLLTDWLCLEVGRQADLSHALAVDRRQSHRVGRFRFQASDSDHALHVCCCRSKGGKAKIGSGFKSAIIARFLARTFATLTPCNRALFWTQPHTKSAKRKVRATTSLSPS